MTTTLATLLTAALTLAALLTMITLLLRGPRP